MKQIIGFAKDLVPLVKKGTKIFTYRLGNKFDSIHVGDIVFAKDSSTGDQFAKLKITKKELTTFQDLPIDRNGHERYPSKEEQKKVFEQYYPNQVQNDSKVIVLKYEVIDLL